MGIGTWLKRLLVKRPKETPQLSEVIGYITDTRGQRKPVRRGAIATDALSNDQLQRIAHLRKVLGAACPITVEEWIDSFRYNANPESKIRIIEACASVYQWLTSYTSWSVHEKLQLYVVLCAISTGISESEVACRLPVDKGLPSLESIANMYRSAHKLRSRP